MGNVVEAVSVVAHDNAFHSVRNYLEGLEWDRVPRLDTWLTDIFGLATTDYSTKVSKRWMISAVGRVMKPGCKADSVLILEGVQGAGKSTAMHVLGVHGHPDRVGRQGLLSGDPWQVDRRAG